MELDPTFKLGLLGRPQTRRWANSSRRLHSITTPSMQEHGFYSSRLTISLPPLPCTSVNSRMNAIDTADFFWDPPTSKANFCETDFAVNKYIAEFINSLTNVVYIIYGIYGLRQLRGKGNKCANSLRVLPNWGLIAVGVCSFAFHLSLKYHTQMTGRRRAQLPGDRPEEWLGLEQVAIFNLGYWLWLVDQWACGLLTKAREAIGLPWSFLLELHGWWHICT
ncbi:uncharacterized protein N7482_002920 [Penicillium canariense]|uniref:Ceramidase n=1 Tax=Penicillium canariense TaxID=189055 RepID=A0A9W9IHY2_9EURO|nr:uncharacterized protein N7482_002920 [Penicillium canariense]KAJ5177043.1 hypothetical protein N7482_002920 [Penicillium canariense]